MKKDLSRDVVNNSGTHFEYDFFKGVFDMDASQERIFQDVAKEVVDSTFNGYNGTIFAYGQTGSGKTFTMTGGEERYEDRGLIPRIISYMFERIENETDVDYKMTISYMQIYMDSGYDLLDANSNAEKLDDLPHVRMFEDEGGSFRLKNLSVHKAAKEEDALNLLFIGHTNRVITDTKMNPVSTRSHCIFIINLEAHKPGTDVKTLSKLQLVDLSGSERAGKSGIEGQTLAEAKSINVTLMFLVNVIIKLNEKAKYPNKDIHIPYRNSMMTMMLRDSIGGNCMTKLISTIHAGKAQINESLSTCEFAKRVALIKNTAKRNEQADPAIIIRKLRAEVSELKAEISLLKGSAARDHLLPEDISKANNMVENFIKSNAQDDKIILKDQLMLNQCFYHFRTLYKTIERRAQQNGGNAAIEDGTSSPGKSDPQEVASLKAHIGKLSNEIKQRDNEIQILIQHIEKGKGNVAVTSTNDSEQEERKTLYQHMTNGMETEIGGKSFADNKSVS